MSDYTWYEVCLSIKQYWKYNAKLLDYEQRSRIREAAWMHCSCCTYRYMLSYLVLTLCLKGIHQNVIFCLINNGKRQSQSTVACRLKSHSCVMQLLQSNMMIVAAIVSEIQT